MKKKTLKAAWQKQCISYREKIQKTADFSSETLEAKKKCHIFQVLKENNRQPKIGCPAELSFKNGEEIKIFSD